MAAAPAHMNLPHSRSGNAASDDAPVYRFAGVVVDVARQQLWVDAAEVACQPLAFRLLVMLCEARGALVSRQALFERLWPGGQDIGDTALTQLIWRLRGALGPAADAIRTVRRGGIRLDADVRIDPLPTPPAEPTVATPAPKSATPGADGDRGQLARDSPAAVPPPSGAAAAGAPPARGRYRHAAVLAALVLLAAVAAGLLFGRDRLISSEYALYASDLDAARADTPELLRLAFAAEHAADVGRARELLAQVAELDTQSPIAPALLAVYSYGNPDQLREWAALAKARVRSQTPPYTRLLVELAQHLGDNGERARQIEEAMLDLRPHAWRVHLALAHKYMAQRQFGKALAAFRRVPLDQPGPGVIVYVLSDRASLGDADAVAAELAAGLLADAPMLDAHVRARLAYARADYAAAATAADHALALADAGRAYDNAVSMAEIGALAAFAQGSPGAAERFLRLLARCDSGRAMCRSRTLGFLAVLAARAGSTDSANTYLAQAWSAARHSWEKTTLQLSALAAGLNPVQDTAAVAALIEPESEFAGHAELLRAWQALADGHRDEAQRRLERARSEGVAVTYLAEHALLLGARLGERVAPCRVDPPYPNGLRLSACAEIARLAKTTP